MPDQEPFDIVQAKLSGVYCSTSVEIPFEMFERYLETVSRTLYDYGLKLDQQDLASDPRIIALFDKQISEACADLMHSSRLYDVSYAVYNMFRSQIQLAEEERRNELKNMVASMTGEGTLIPVDQKNYEKAMAILRAAGLVDTDVTNIIDRLARSAEDDAKCVGMPVSATKTTASQSSLQVTIKKGP